MTSGIRVTPDDLSQMRYCRKGSREFFDRHELNWPLFLKEGIPVETIESIDDEMAREAARHARDRAGRLNE